MGFAFMEAFMDSLTVQSAPGKGTKVMMEKIIGKSEIGKSEISEDGIALCSSQGA